MTLEDDAHDVAHTPEWAVGYESDPGAEYEEPYEPQFKKPGLSVTSQEGGRIRAEWEGISYTEEQWAFYVKYGYWMPSATVGCNAGCLGLHITYEELAFYEKNGYWIDRKSVV